MNEITQSRTLWSQSMFDALLVALRRQQADDRVRELLTDLRRKGYSVNVIANKVVHALGPRAAARVQQLAGATPVPTRTRHPHRVRRTRRLRNWAQDVRDSIEDAFDDLRRALRRT